MSRRVEESPPLKLRRSGKTTRRKQLPFKSSFACIIDHLPVDRWRGDLWSPEITVQIADELPVGSVELEYRVNGGGPNVRFCVRKNNEKLRDYIVFVPCELNLNLIL